MYQQQKYLIIVSSPSLRPRSCSRWAAWTPRPGDAWNESMRAKILESFQDLILIQYQIV